MICIYIPRPIHNMTTRTSDKTFIIVDTSYAIFYRFHATKRWYSFAHREDFNSCENLFVDEVFKAKFKKLFITMFKPLFKKYNSDFGHVVFAVDCPRSEIWRHQHIEKYKGTRVLRKEDAAIGDFFKYTYRTIIPELIETHSSKQIKYDTLEGDDCIYIVKNIIRETYPVRPIVIIGSDHDLMQLLDTPSLTSDTISTPLINVITLKDKSLTDKSCGDSEKDLQIKIIIGDKSDNIPACFPKCGYKTALKLVNDNILLEKKFKTHEGSREIYNRNTKLISFKHIPTELYTECYSKYKDMFM